MLEQQMIRGYELGKFTNWNERLIYMGLIDEKYTYNEISVSPIDAYRYQGNLYGLFKKMGINPGLWFYTMSLNGYTNPLNYEGKTLTFKVPVMPPIPDA